MSYDTRNIYDLSGRVAVVTGGGTGIGLMISQGLASNGAKVYITGRRVDVLQKVADSWNQRERRGKIIAYDLKQSPMSDV
jgi:NADP-dependent 3-hydroxy acid dehydrogenase YdfG